MSYQVDEYGRYRFPMLPNDRVRVIEDCSCGWGMDGPERVWLWLSDRHAHAHNKGIDGLAAASTGSVQRIAVEDPEPEPEAGQILHAAEAFTERPGPGHAQPSPSPPQAGSDREAGQ